MSPFGNSGSSGSGKNGRMMIVGTPPALQQQHQQQQQQLHQQQSFSFTGSRRKTTSDQMMMSYSSSSSTNNGLDHRSFLHDPFASSAPSMSLFQQYSGEQLWRNGTTPRTNMISNDFIGLRSSPRESDHIISGSSPFRTTTYLSSSIGGSGFSRQPSSSSYVTPGTLSNGGFHDDYFVSRQQQQQQHQEDYDDLNDAMLPSSLNDLFTPSELHVRSLRQQESSTLENRVPFYNNMKSRTTEYEDNKGTAAINIPGVTNGSGGNSSGTGTGVSDYLQQREDDDDVQFFMEDDEAVTYDHMNSKYNNYPSLISLPST